MLVKSIISNNPKFSINNIILLMMIGIYWLKSIILAHDIFEVPDKDVRCKNILRRLIFF